MAEATFSMFRRTAPSSTPELPPPPAPSAEPLSALRALLQPEPPPPTAVPTPAPPAPGAADATPPEALPEAGDARASRREARRLLRQALEAEPPSPAPAMAPLPAPGAQQDAAKPAPLPSQPAEAAAAPAPAHAYTLSLAAAHQLLGVANPLVCSVSSTIGEGAPVQLSTRRSKMYRPDGAPPALPRFGYDAVPDTRTGLLAGSRVLTARGEIPVEHLTPGDAVLTLRGPALLPITWIGCSAASEPPVEIAAGALGPGRPRQALRVAAGHPVFLDADPVAAGTLVNGTSIRSLDLRDATLFHVGVGAAEVLLAEGVLLASAVR